MNVTDEFKKVIAAAKKLAEKKRARKLAEQAKPERRINRATKGRFST